MSEEDKLIQQELVDEIMKASEQFPNVILYMETVMESYEELEKENQQLKEVIDEVREIVEQIAACPYANFDIETKEDSYQVSISKWLDNLLQILNKIKEN